MVSEACVMFRVSARCASIRLRSKRLWTFFCPGWISFLSKQLALRARSLILEMATLGENLPRGDDRWV